MVRELKEKVGRIAKTWGPAWLVMIADVDAASAITAAESGAQYGTKLVWFLMLLTFPLYVIQEVAGRVGAVTGKGLGELIRENYSRRIAVFCAMPMALVDIISYVVEYTGIAVGFEMMGVSPWVSVPIAFLAHVIVVYKRKYIEAERPLLVISVIFTMVWIVAAFLTARNGNCTHAILFFHFLRLYFPISRQYRGRNHAFYALLPGVRDGGKRNK